MYKHYPYDDDSMNVASSGECTGIVPVTPESLDSMESYNDIYDIPLPKVCNDRRTVMNNQNKNSYSDEYSNRKDSNQNSNKKDSNQSSNKKDYNQNSNRSDSNKR